MYGSNLITRISFERKHIEDIFVTVLQAVSGRRTGEKFLQNILLRILLSHAKRPGNVTLSLARVAKYVFFPVKKKFILKQMLMLYLGNSILPRGKIFFSLKWTFSSNFMVMFLMFLFVCFFIWNFKTNKIKVVYLS